jgi:hypothetical protein
MEFAYLNKNKYEKMKPHANKDAEADILEQIEMGCP